MGLHFRPCRNSNPDSAAEAPSSERSFVVEPRAFMQQHDGLGLSVVVGRAGALIYEDAFGFAEMIVRDRLRRLTHPAVVI
jgi:hypothetical protein